MTDRSSFKKLFAASQSYQHPTPSNYPPPPARRLRSCASQFTLQTIIKLTNQYEKTKAIIENATKISRKPPRCVTNLESIDEVDEDLDALVQRDAELDFELSRLREDGVRELCELELQLKGRKIRFLESFTHTSNLPLDSHCDPGTEELEVHKEVLNFAGEAWKKHADNIVRAKLSSSERKKEEILKQKESIKKAKARLCGSLDLRNPFDSSTALGSNEESNFTGVSSLIPSDNESAVVTKPTQRTLHTPREAHNCSPKPPSKPSASLARPQDEPRTLQSGAAPRFKSQAPLPADLSSIQAEVHHLDKGFAEVENLVDELLTTVAELREDNAALTVLAEDIALPVLARNFETLKRVKREGRNVSLENTRGRIEYGVIENGDMAISSGHVAAHFAAWKLLDFGVIGGHSISEEAFVKMYGITVDDYETLFGVSVRLDELFDMHARLAACGSFTPNTLFKRKDLRFLRCFVDILNTFYSINVDSMKEKGEIFDSMEKVDQRLAAKLVYMRDLVELYELSQEAENKTVNK
ncbi:hypothetical protein ACMFMG_010978 [Clarireedia jacksonii]